MNVLDLGEELGLQPKRSAATNGGEYHSPCPSCGGIDRFCIWPSQGFHGKYWCRRCGAHGDGIQFCRDFLGLSFTAACSKVGTQPHKQSHRRSSTAAAPENAPQTSPLFLEAAGSFVQACHKNLLENADQLAHIEQRGISLTTARKFELGVNRTHYWEPRKLWGLPEVLKEDGKRRRIWLPPGLVVPARSSGCHSLHKVKIRRYDWRGPEDGPKYVEVSGSQQQLAVYGDPSLAIVVVESELDGILIQQEAGDICCSLACGGVSKRPDLATHMMLRRSHAILVSLDFDEAGTKGLKYWRSTYPNAVFWPVPHGKSPGDAFLAGLNVNRWISLGLKKALGA
ncbi:MAG: zinc-binding protein [Chlamydiia bacterium]|nr:zinc-binding protein [Chlamydiia bacterium]